MDLAGYKINDEYYCPNCTREYCLFNLCLVLTESEMVELMPTKKFATEDLVRIVNSRSIEDGESHNDILIRPVRQFDFSESMKKIRYLSELKNFDQKQCANYHEFSHPQRLSENSIYR